MEGVILKNHEFENQQNVEVESALYYTLHDRIKISHCLCPLRCTKDNFLSALHS